MAGLVQMPCASRAREKNVPTTLRVPGAALRSIIAIWLAATPPGPLSSTRARLASIDRSAAPGTRKVVGTFFSRAREAHGIWTNPANDLLYIAHEQNELPGTPNAGQTCCTSFDVSDPLNPKFIAQIPLGALKLPSGELRNKKSINLVYVRPGYKGQTA